jgi:predicted dithiol-disulfide oxidoreductase (DUF899 family)
LQVVSRNEWLTARKELLVKEKAAVRASDELHAQLQNELPMVKVDKEYTFEGVNGKITLPELFDGRKQLIIYHFMLGPDDEAGCAGCSFVADNLPSSLSHLHSRDTTLVLISRAPLAKIEEFRKRMGWNYPWYSAFGSDFNYDFHVSLDEAVAPAEYNYKPTDPPVKGERPGLSVFLKEGGALFHTYSTYARGLDGLLVTNKLLDVTPLGRQDKGVYWKLHDEYEDGKKAACH